MNASRWSITRRVAVTLVVTGALIGPGAARAQEPVVTDSGAVTAPDFNRVLATRGTPAPVEVQHYRPHDTRGINVFEPPKLSATGYNGFAMQWGAAFTQQYQALDHTNSAVPVMTGTPPVNKNQLIMIGNGYNNAVANLYLDAQLARGIRVEMTSYLSSRHHNETWVKDGYLLVDASPYDVDVLNKLMEVLTLRVGHFEINYGDAHFRRTDNGNALFNPLVGNLIMDAFTTEVGGEAYLRKNGFLLMGGITNGEVRGTVQQPQSRAASYLAKVGYDRQINPDLRVRVTGSMYTTEKSANNTLYSGSRAGSRYYDVLENTQSTEAAQAWSGDLQPGFRSKVRAVVANPFLVFHGFEYFGNYEQARGRAANETTDRTFTQISNEGLYRFCANQLYLAGRFNKVYGQLAGMPNDVTIDRVEVGGGWFITPNIMMKGEYVKQRYLDFPATDIRNGGKFEGMMIEGVVAF